MAYETVTMYPYVRLTQQPDGSQSRYVQMFNWKTESKVEDGGDTIVIALPEIEVTVQFADDLRPQALEILRANRQKLKAEHQALLTKLQWLENQLLAIEQSEVLDPVEPRVRFYKEPNNYDDE